MEGRDLEAKHPSEFKETIPSDPALISEAEERFKRFLSEQGLSEDSALDVELGFREGLVNAVIHGNRGDASKSVEISAHNEGGRLVVLIRDEGEGFSIKEVPDPLDTSNLMKTSGRGILMMRNFFDAVSYEGNELRLVKNL